MEQGRVGRAVVEGRSVAKGQDLPLGLPTPLQCCMQGSGLAPCFCLWLFSASWAFLVFSSLCPEFAPAAHACSYLSPLDFRF